MEERAAAKEYTVGPYTVRWRLDNQRDLVLAIVTRTVLNIGYGERLLDRLAKRFAELVGEGRNNVERRVEFGEEFAKMVQRAEEEVESARKMRSFEEKEKSSTSAKEDVRTAVEPQQQAVVEEQEDEDEQQEAAAASSESQQQEAGAAASSSEGPLSADEIKKRILARQGKGKKPAAPKASPPTKKEKQQRVWDSGSGGKVNKKKADELSKSKSAATLEDAVEKGSQRVQTYKLDEWSEDEEEAADTEVANDNNNANAEPVKRGFFGNLLRGLTGRTLDAADLEPVLNDLRDHLIKKNVASDVSNQLCQSVQSSLMGKHLGSLASVSNTVTEALRVALTKILTPKHKVDILRDVEAANAQGRPYSIVFVGINGVGKSTNLAKVASWLLSNQKKVLIAACDTFRSGAVEQLAVHCRNLDIPLFQQGYGNDAAAIAQHALLQAKKDRQDVVLIDTAGRMQDNERLMQALAKLVAVNRPDLILFVGEALAGNDSVDQLTKFNQALVDYAGPSTEKPRTVDGIMLSKFDTVDDQVGTAVSLVYSSGLPIVFLGTGQHYSDLKKLNVAAVVKALLK